MSAALKSPAPRYGSAAQVAAYSGLGAKTIRRLVERGEVHGFKVGRRLLIPFEGIDRHIAESWRTLTMATIPRTELAEARPLVAPLDAEELRRRNRAAAALLDSWEAEGDEAEQTAAFEVLKEALGERRVLSSRPAL